MTYFTLKETKIYQSKRNLAAMLNWNEMDCSDCNGNLMQRLQRDIWIACSTDSGTLTLLKETARSPERLTVEVISQFSPMNGLHADTYESVQAVHLCIFVQWQNKKVSITSAYNNSTTGKKPCHAIELDERFLL